MVLVVARREDSGVDVSSQWIVHDEIIEKHVEHKKEGRAFDPNPTDPTTSTSSCITHSAIETIATRQKISGDSVKIVTSKQFGERGGVRCGTKYKRVADRGAMNDYLGDGICSC